MLRGPGRAGRGRKISLPGSIVAPVIAQGPETRARAATHSCSRQQHFVGSRQSSTTVKALGRSMTPCRGIALGGIPASRGLINGLFNRARWTLRQRQKIDVRVRGSRGFASSSICASIRHLHSDVGGIKKREPPTQTPFKRRRASSRRWSAVDVLRICHFCFRPALRGHCAKQPGPFKISPRRERCQTYKGLHLVGKMAGPYIFG